MSLLSTSTYKLSTDERAFTLIEALIYIVLFTIVVGGGIATAFYLIQGTDDLRREAFAQAEANFVLRRIDQLLVNSNSITSPINSTDDSITVASGDTILLQDGIVYFDAVDPDNQLTSGNNEVTTLDFIHDGTTDPEELEIVLTMEGNTYNKIHYLR